MKEKIIVIELHQETNSFSNVPTTIREFESLALYYGQEMFDKAKNHRFQVSGFLKAVRKFGKGQIQPIPTLSAWATSGGPVERKVYEHFKKLILKVVKENPDLAGIYVSMHGAMGVEGMRDPESDLLLALREIVGFDLPIGVSYDLHANITEEKVRLATFINAYRTNPHRDHFRVGLKAGEILIKTVLGEVKPIMVYRKMRLLKGGGLTIEFLKPMRGIFHWMKKQGKNSEVLCLSNFMVHIWLDDEELGWSTIAVTDGNKALAEELADELADQNWKVRDHAHPVPKTLEEAIQNTKKAWWRRKLGTVIFCDLSDIVAAGAPGENTHILQKLRENQLTSYIPFRDVEAVNACFSKGENQPISLELGLKLEKTYNQSILIEGKVVKLAETEFGKTAVVQENQTFIFLTELPNPAFFPKFFRKLGFPLWKADVIVVKNLFPFRFYYLLYNRKTLNVATSGTTNLDVHQLEYQKIPRPIYPLDPIKDWRMSNKN